MNWNIEDVSGTDASVVAIGLYGSILCIFILPVIASHSIYRFYRYRAKKEFSSNIKITICMELLMIFCYLLSIIAAFFVRVNYFSKINEYNRPLCTFGYLATVYGYNCGHFLSYIIYIYRVYISFQNSAYQISKKCVYILIILEFAAILFLSVMQLVLVYGDYGYNRWTLFNISISDSEHFIFCSKLVASRFYFYFYCLVFYSLMDIISSFYILFLFVSRLYHLKRELIGQDIANKIELSITSKSSKTGTSTPSGSPTNKQKNTDNNNNANLDITIKLKKITTKQSILASIAICSHFIVAILTVPAIYGVWGGAFGVYSSIFTVLSVHLMYSFCNTIWSNILCCGYCKKT